MERHTYTINELIDICEKSFIKEDNWNNRDSESAQRQLGECYVLLKDGCEYKINENSTDNFILLTIYSKGFTYFDWGNNVKEEREYYIPTYKRLEETNGKDWY